MKYRIFLSFLLMIPGLMLQAGNSPAGFDKTGLYQALSSENLELINTQLADLKSSTWAEKDAYEGALLMKKSGLVKGAKEKLSLFKTGRVKLEACISKNNSNIEYRFLRLMIQEHAPKIVKYSHDIETDSQLIRSNFKNLPEFLQKFILDYAKNSKALKIP